MILLANVFYFIQNNFYTFLVLFLLSLTLMVLILLLDILLNNKLSKFINKQKNIKSYSVPIIICLGILNILLIFSGINSLNMIKLFNQYDVNVSQEYKLNTINSLTDLNNRIYSQISLQEQQIKENNQIINEVEKLKSR